ncbi:hypothetical protein AAEO56_07095 [Flavobacterium sp. DGU11]|uniref:Uncharacterized protein n=1 Tax=Flavobacterium arundinis TaxID=3139143 RepID=A0ABU9HV41_9FLAO
MTTALVIMIVVMVGIALVNVIKINMLALQIIKDKETNNRENPLEKNYQFIKGLY